MVSIPIALSPEMSMDYVQLSIFPTGIKLWEFLEVLKNKRITRCFLGWRRRCIINAMWFCVLTLVKGDATYACRPIAVAILPILLLASGFQQRLKCAPIEAPNLKLDLAC